MVKRNEFIDDNNLTELSSLTHLLDKNNTDSDDTDEAIVIKHSPYFSETSFINLLGTNEGLTVLDLNVCNAFTKFDELELFIERVNINNPKSVICLNECWLNSKSDLSPIHLSSYNMFYQVGNYPGHGHCGLITYVHKTYRSEEFTINLDATG